MRTPCFAQGDTGTPNHRLTPGAGYPPSCRSCFVPRRREVASYPQKKIPHPGRKFPIKKIPHTLLRATPSCRADMLPSGRDKTNSLRELVTYQLADYSLTR